MFAGIAIGLGAALLIAYTGYALLIAPMLDDFGARERGELVPAAALREAQRRATEHEQQALAQSVRREAEAQASALALSEARRLTEALLLELRDQRRESTEERGRLLAPVLGLDLRPDRVGAESDDEEIPDEERVAPYVDDFAQRIAAVAAEEGVPLDVPVGERP